MARAVGVALRVVAMACVSAAIVLEAYTFAVQPEGASLPPLFGNFEANRAVLEGRPPKADFTFAVVGDTRSVGTFQSIVDRLRKMPLDFVVVLGDMADGPTQAAHRFLRAELAREYALPCPTFYVAGDADVGREGFRIGDFEQAYGPSTFSFRYQDCLFVVLRVIGRPSDAQSYAVLRDLAKAPRAGLRHVFVFLHIPPVVAAPGAEGLAIVQPLVRLLRQVGADYVFAGHIHVYQRLALGSTTYLITGGGGARLREQYGPQVHHAVAIRVGKDFIQETLVPAPSERELGDVVERFAFVGLWPWMAAHWGWAAIGNGLGLAALVVLLRSLLRLIRRGSHPAREPALTSRGPRGVPPASGPPAGATS